jgi:hypothetical protein
MSHRSAAPRARRPARARQTAAALFGQSEGVDSQVRALRSSVVAATQAVVAVVACTASGLVWAVAAVAGGAAVDPYPADYYDAGNRFAFFVLLVMLIVACPAACLLGYGFTRIAGWPMLRSLAVAQLAPAALAVPAFFLLS